MTVISLSLRNDGGGLPFREDEALRNESHFEGMDFHFERKMDLLWIDCGFIRRGSRFDMRGKRCHFGMRIDDRHFKRRLDLSWIWIGFMAFLSI